MEIKDIGSLKSHKISYNKYAEYYDFTSSEECVDDFLQNVRLKFKSSDSNFTIKCGFTIENMQLPPTEYDVLILSICYWSTEPYKSTCFNNFAFFSLKENILKRVINNGMTGSSWRFSKFIYLNLKVLKEPRCRYHR